MENQQQQSPPSSKRLSLDKIIEAMTADPESTTGHYVQFGISPQRSNGNWDNYTGAQRQQYKNNQSLSQDPGNSPTVVNADSPQIYMEHVASYEANSPEPLYFPSQTINHLSINEKNDLINTIDVGGSNFIDVIYNDASQIVAKPCEKLNDLNSYTNQGMIDGGYDLFGEQNQSVNRYKSTIRSAHGKQLIDNLVGNWVQNKSGTYSPFGSFPNVTPVPQSNVKIVEHIDEFPRDVYENLSRKPRVIAEDKPMRPSYSDVLTKSASPAIPIIANCTPIVKPQFDDTIIKNITGNSGNSKDTAVLLKRQNSSGSDDRGSPKMQISKRTFEHIRSSNLSRRWVSLDNLGSQLESQNINDFNRSDDFQKQPKLVKNIKKMDKTTEALNNCKPHNNSLRTTEKFQKRPPPINNNFNYTNAFKQSPLSDQIDKSHQTNNKINKDDKKNFKEKNSKRFHGDKGQPMKKGQKSRNRESRESPIEKVCHYFNKNACCWSKFGLKMFYWLLHLISDVVSMSTNLIVQFGKCSWYATVIYMKHSTAYVAAIFSNVTFLTIFGKRIADWFGNNKFTFWRNMRSKNNDDRDEYRSWMHSELHTSIALPNTGEEAMKRLLACKGKDPYSILGVTPTCSDDDIKKYYKRQAFLVHPDKNSQPGAEEAFKILVHAFDIIGEPERRKSFDQVWQVEAAWGEMSGFLNQLHRKMEQATNTIRCTNCGLRHKRVPTQRPCYAARLCSQCRIRHSAKEGDIWAESRIIGFVWNYYACMEGTVYDVTEWAACQASNLKHLRANTHSVQYRIVSGQKPPFQTSAGGRRKHQNDSNTSGADFEDLLNNLYNHSKSKTVSSTGEQMTAKSENRRRKARRK